jgi:hypothetical protein
MIKPIRLKEINRLGQRTRIIREHLNEQQPMGASSAALDPKTAKVKGLFEMFGFRLG